MSSRLKSGPHRSALPFAFLLCAAAVAAQEDGFQSNGLFSLPRSQDDIFEWRTARDEIRQGRFTEAVERLHALLSSRRHGVVPVQEGVDRWLGQRMAVIETLRELPPEGAAAYDRLTAREAGSLVRSAFESNDVGELTALAHGFPTSDAGRRARIRLGALALERGDVDQAVRHWLAARDATSAQYPEYERTVHRLQLARALLEGDRARGALGEVDADAVQAARASLPQLDASRAWIDHYGWPRRTFDPPLGEPRLHAQHAVEAYGYD
ncbi:MAG TPA: hypothetical protein VK081_01535, partial [Planctomycetota bacterium]|nr:hypothetical protein [Planctomycetota bacterium]